MRLIDQRVDQRDRSLIFFHKNLRITLFYMYLCSVFVVR